MTRIRTIAAALMLTTALLATATYATTNEDENQAEVKVSKSITAPELTIEETDYEPEQQESAANRNIRNESKENNHKSKESGSSNWIAFLGLILGAGGVAIGVLNNKKIQELDRKHDMLKSQTKKEFTNIKGHIETLQQDLATARQKIGMQAKGISALRASQASLKADINSSHCSQEALQPEQVTQYSQLTIDPSNSVQQTIRLYCGAPKDGVFYNPSTNQFTKALYVITSTGERSSKYSFIDTRDSAMLAARSISDFLEPGCVISGTKNPNFTKVITITPGFVHQMPNGTWIIESKAVVELV